MKKSKIIQNSRDMLSRSFNPAKCKIALKLAASRMKLLKNKKEVQVTKMKREIAQLLESGQDRTARIRVEHVTREEKMMAAYDLLEIYCELIVARLPIIESQKNCPIDLKEAIASIVFAAPRCGDIQELQDLRKQFTAKYGKDFTTAAVELRPQCGVGRLLVEKLSTVSPDGQTKMKILSMIAEEHHVKWDPMSFDEEDLGSHGDLLNGSSTSGKENKSYVGLGPSYFENADVHALPVNNNIHSSTSNLSQQDAVPSLKGEKTAPTPTSGVSMTSHFNAVDSVDDRTPSFQVNGSGGFPDTRSWNFDFKDAASAAQVAAESAEIASMAARVAAELSNHGRTRGPYFTGSQNSNVNILNHKGHQIYQDPELSSEQISEEFGTPNRSSFESSKPQNNKMDIIEGEDSKTDKRFKGVGVVPVASEESRYASLNPKTSSHNDFVDQGIPFEEPYPPDNSFGEVSDSVESFNKRSFKHEAETGNKRTDKAESFQSESSSHSQFRDSDDVNIFATFTDLKVETDPGKNLFVHAGDGSTNDDDGYDGLHLQKFDSDSDDNSFSPGPTYDDRDSEFRSLSPLVQKSTEGQSLNPASWSPMSNSIDAVESTAPSLFFTRKSSFPDFPDSISKDDPGADNFVSATFDDSDGVSSEVDEDRNTGHQHHMVENPRDLYKHIEDRDLVESQFEKSLLKDKIPSGSGKLEMRPPFNDELKSGKMNLERTYSKDFYPDSLEKTGHTANTDELPVLNTEDARMNFNYTDKDYDPSSVERLNFGKLTGGFRHKSNKGLPFLRNQLDVSSSAQRSERNSSSINPAAAISHSKLVTVQDHKKSTGLPLKSESDSSEDEAYMKETQGQGKHSLGTMKEVKTKSGSGAPDFISRSDNINLDEDPPKISPPRRSHLRSAVSQRTKPSPASRKNSDSMMHIGSEPSYSDAFMEKKNSGFRGPLVDSAEATDIFKESKTGYRSGTVGTDSSLPSSHQEHQFERKKISQGENSGQHTPSKVIFEPTNADSSVYSEISNSGTSAPVRKQYGMNSQKLSAARNPSIPKQESKVSIPSDAPKTAVHNETSGDSRETTKKVSHVHPKLPDYDTLVQSLRKSRS